MNTFSMPIFIVPTGSTENEKQEATYYTSRIRNAMSARRFKNVGSLMGFNFEFKIPELIVSQYNSEFFQNMEKSISYMNCNEFSR
jgi:hypothetical protein